MQLTKSENDLESRQLSLFGKTSPECLAPKITLSEAFLQDLPEKSYRLSQQGKNGQTQVLCLTTSGKLHGEPLTLNFSESPNRAAECSLWQVLEMYAHPKYSLSTKAVKGIMYRAWKRNKTIPAQLQEAMDHIISQS